MVVVLHLSLALVLETRGGGDGRVGGVARKVGEVRSGGRQSEARSAVQSEWVGSGHGCWGGCC